MSETRACEGLNASQEPCGARPLKPGTAIDGIVVSGRWCRQHDQDLPDSARIGGAQPGAGRPRKPRAVEVLRERIEADIERFLAPIEEALEATSGVVVGNGPSAHLEVLPDYSTRLKAAAMALDRVYGRPRQAVELTGEDGGPVETVSIVPLDAEARSAAAAALLEKYGHA